MAADLTRASCAVVLRDEATASGLADMLHQFLAQTVASSPGKARLACRLRGALLFRAAEDELLTVSIAFSGAGIEVGDAPGPDPSLPMLTADFLTTAHLTTGEERPLGLLVRRRMRVRFRLGQALFLWRVLGLLRIAPEGAPARARWRWALAVGLLALAALAVLAVALVALTTDNR
ncbi:MAG: hypothetical protein HY908_35495 [Myxococcales bacterium]|nr:hypothetical protein [Myxococcales bacterium]